MPSSISFASSTDTSSPRHSIYSSPRREKMSLTQTYFLAHSARGKLSKEAARADHDLRLLVGHANMLDTLMIDLANAEQEQERWFNQSLPTARQAPAASRVDPIREESEPEWQLEDAESSDEETEFEPSLSLAPAVEVDDDMELDDQEDELDSLALVRTQSRHSPPELTSDSDSESDDDAAMPPSPTDPAVNVLSPIIHKSKPVHDFLSPHASRPTIIAAY